MATALKTKREIEYPESDGKPMAETDIHRDVMFDVIYRLKSRYARRQDVYVTGNLLVYYAEGDPKTSLAPDCFVVFGVPSGDRRTFKIWVEGKFPEVSDAVGDDNAGQARASGERVISDTGDAFRKSDAGEILTITKRSCIIIHITFAIPPASVAIRRSDVGDSLTESDAA